jgi:thioredoxin-related protein
MAAKYYVAVRPRINENHAVHKEGCPFLADEEERIFLGVFTSNHDAVKESRQHFFSSEGCVFCSKEQKPHNIKTTKNELVEKELIQAELEGPSSFHQGLVYCVN